jgi:hypothetical protein
VTTFVDSPALATLGRLGADLAAGAGSATLVQRLVHDLGRPFCLDFAVRYELAPAERTLRLHTTTGVASRHRPALKVLQLGEAVCGRVAERRRPEAHRRVDADPDERLALARELDARAYASFPLTAGSARSEAEQRSAHLQTALATNRTIAMAIGIVMARTGRTDEQARAWLADASQRSNRKMRALAEQIVLTGSIEL